MKTLKEKALEKENKVLLAEVFRLRQELERLETKLDLVKDSLPELYVDYQINT